jgi:trk system potassium uptake protein TrkH
MSLHSVQRILGILLMLFSLSLLPPVLVSWLYADGALVAFVQAFGLLLILGALIWLPVRNNRRELRLRDGFLVVVLFWTALGLGGSVPLILADLNLSITDAVFESISGLTTTGATVISGLEQLPHSVLYYRQQLQWLGGMGIIVLAVAVLPMLGIGGMQMFRAETPGPMKGDNKLTPRITETAKALWFIYLGLTLACTLAYWLAGMSLFDAIGHAYATLSIGGFSTHDASLGFFDNIAIELVAVVFMFIAGVNFALHFLAWRRRSVLGYWQDSEFRFYAAVLALVTLLVTLVLYREHVYLDWQTSLIRALFQAVSIGTTTGFTTAEYHLWPGFVTILLLFSSCVGGCANSTAGGIKAIRVLLLIKQGMREITRLIHPNIQVPVKVGRRLVAPRVVEAVWGFFVLYIGTFSLMYLALAWTGLDLMTAFSAVAACINNLGPGLGQVGPNYAGINDPAKWILCFAMLLGRLEIFTLLVILTPSFWRQ